MAIQHSAITDPNIHEPKGVSTADNGQLYVANGTGSGTWKRIVSPFSGTPTGDITIDANSSAYITYALTPLLSGGLPDDSDIVLSIQVLIGVASTYLISSSYINSSGNLIVNIANLSGSEISAPLGILTSVLTIT